MKCQNCGFDHSGWLFEQGYEKLCVKCGNVLAAGEEYDPLLDPTVKRPGFLGRILHGFPFRRKGEREPRFRNVPLEEETWKPVAPQGIERSPEGPFDLPDLPLEEIEIRPGFPFVEKEKDPELFPVVKGSDADLPPIREEQEAPDQAVLDRPLDEGPDSIEDCRKVVARAPDNVNAYKQLGRLLFLEGRYEEAVDSLEQALERAPDDPLIWGELGRIYYRGAKEYSKSIACCERALSLDDKPVWIQCDLCLALLHDGRFEEAKKGFLRIIRTLQDGNGSEDEYQDNIQTLLHDCLGELYKAKKEASGSLLKEITDIIELLELEKIYFH